MRKTPKIPLLWNIATLSLISHILYITIWTFVMHEPYYHGSITNSYGSVAISISISIMFTVVSLLFSKLLFTILPLNHSYKRVIIYAIVLLILNNVIAYTLVQISIYLSEYTESNIQMLKGLYAYSTIATFFSCVYSLSHYSNSYISVKEEKQRLELALMEEKEKALQAQLMSLKLQINPHFIFNNHNILEELISKDPLTAKKFLQSMSSFYRYIIGNIESDTIQIGKEIEFIEAYIQL